MKRKITIEVEVQKERARGTFRVVNSQKVAKMVGRSCNHVSAVALGIRKSPRIKELTDKYCTVVAI